MNEGIKSKEIVNNVKFVQINSFRKKIRERERERERWKERAMNFNFQLLTKAFHKIHLNFYGS